MANTQNLRTPTHEEAVAMGKKSAQKKQEKRTRIQAILAAFDQTPLDKREADLIDRHLLTMTQEELVAFANDLSKPASMRIRANSLIQKNLDERIKADERIRNRAFGKPKLTVDAAVDMTAQGYITIASI